MYVTDPPCPNCGHNGVNLTRRLQVAGPAFAPEEGASSVYVDGASNIVGRTEFEDASRLRALFQTFEQKSRLVKIVTACLDGAGVRVVIGRQIPDPDLQGVALVTTAVAVGIMPAPCP